MTTAHENAQTKNAFPEACRIWSGNCMRCFFLDKKMKWYYNQSKIIIRNYGGIILRGSLKLRLAIFFIALFCIGISSLVSASQQQSQLSKGLDDFNYLSESRFQKGKFVEGYVYEVYGEFAYEEMYSETLGVKHNSRVTSHYYLIPLTGSFETDSPKFIALEIRTEEGVKNAELLMEQTWNYQETGVEPDEWNEFPIQGKISELDSEIEGYLYEWLTNDGADGTRADYVDMICPYVISEYAPGAVDRGMTIGVVFTLIGLLGIGGTAFVYFRARRGESLQVIPQSQDYVAYDPVNGNAAQTGSFGNTTASGSVASPADGGETERLMREMSKLSQPADADEFFSSPVKREEPKVIEEPKKDMDGLDTSGLGIGIADEDK